MLPSRDVLVGGVRYSIHGLIHGTPWIRIDPSFKSLIAKDLCDLSVICEDGFISWVPFAVSMDETEYFGFGESSYLKKIRILSSLLMSYLSSLGRRSSEIEDRIKSMDSLDDLFQIREILFRGYHPEPEGMNVLMKEAHSGTIDSPRGRVPLRVRRYIYEAKRSLDYAREKGLDKLHLVVGCAHELPLEYLLKNEPVLEKYSL